MNWYDFKLTDADGVAHYHATLANSMFEAIDAVKESLSVKIKDALIVKIEIIDERFK